MKVLKYAKALKKYIADKNYRFLIDAGKGKYDKLSDREYLEKKFYAMLGYSLDLSNPQTFNEKLQWLKLYDRKPEYTMMVDKYKVREYIKEKLGEEYLIPLLGVWDKAEDINFDKLPNRFVLKCNHNSGLGMYICKDKSKLTENQIKAIRKNLAKGLQQDYYLTGREWTYKDVPRKIIAEKYMEDHETGELRDYKFFCFNGKVDCVMLCLERNTGHTKFYFFDRDWNLLRYNIRGKNAPEGFTIDKPSNIEAMFDLAARLSKGMPFVRIDLYNVNNHIFFGEYTFFPDSGFDANILKETDNYFGNLITLGERNENSRISNK